MATPARMRQKKGLNLEFTKKDFIVIHLKHFQMIYRFALAEISRARNDKSIFRARNVNSIIPFAHLLTFASAKHT